MNKKEYRKQYYKKNKDIENQQSKEYKESHRFVGIVIGLNIWSQKVAKWNA